jgi:hypothetical protein
MKYSVCTLFEKHYHHGVGVLSNSLIQNGFKGDIYVGYRGSVPQWASAGKHDPNFNWGNSISLQVTPEVNLHFLPIGTNAHFTNYKAHFMLDLWEGVAKDSDAMYYFDPDIVFTADWKYFQEWVECGVAVCEDVNSPVWENNHRRVGWRAFFKPFGHELKFKEPVYVNGGFVGVSKNNKKILEIWRQMMENVAPRIGGLNKSPLPGEAMPDSELGPFTLFGKSDQDVLNAAIEAYEGKISFAGKEGMGFVSGAALIPHALGSMKPWVYQPLKEIVNGVTPRVVDKHYWKYANSPLQAHSDWQTKSMKFRIRIASLIARFYRRGEA